MKQRANVCQSRRGENGAKQLDGKHVSAPTIRAAWKNHAQGHAILHEESAGCASRFAAGLRAFWPWALQEECRSSKHEIACGSKSGGLARKRLKRNLYNQDRSVILLFMKNGILLDDPGHLDQLDWFNT